MDVSLAQLRSLVAVADHGSFGAAAEALNLSQSAVSHAVAGLERALGGPVFHRSPAVAPTSLGESVLPHARAVLASLRALDTSASRHRGVLSGSVRLAAVPTVCQGLLPRLLDEWAVRLPRVQVQVFEGDDHEMPQWLEAGTVDVAILVDAQPAPPGSRLVAVDDFRAVVRRDHPLAGQPSLDLADLLDDPLIVSAGGCESQVRRLHRENGLRYAPAQHVRELGTLISMVGRGVGVSIMPSLGAGMLPASLRMIPLSPRRTRTLSLSGPASRPWHPLAQALVDAATEGEPGA